MTRRTLLFLLTGLLVLSLAGAAAALGSSKRPTTPGKPASVGTGGSQKEAEPADDEQEGEANHGGSVGRIHDTCALPDGVSLTGNWTHGDYVSAWAKSDPTTARDAAHSPCGKPVPAVAGTHGQSKSGAKHGPPSTIPPPEPQPPTPG